MSSIMSFETAWSDQWDPNCKASAFVIENENVVRNTMSTWKSVFGQQSCEAPYKYHWTLKIVAKLTDVSNAWPPLVGIQNDAQTKRTDDYFTSGTSTYALICGHAKLTVDGSCGKSYGAKWTKEGDVLDIYLDMTKRTLSFGINGTKYGVAHNVNAGKYRLALSLYNGRKVQMISSSRS